MAVLSADTLQTGSANKGVGGVNYTGSCGQFTVYSHIAGDAGKSYSINITPIATVATGINSVSYNCISKSKGRTDCGVLDASTQPYDTLYCYGKIGIGTSASSGTTYNGSGFSLNVEFFSSGSCDL